MSVTLSGNRERSMARAIETSKQLLVEGRTAEIFFRQWIQDTNLQGQIQVRDFGSIAELTGYIKVFSNQKKFKEQVSSLGIIRDAEDCSARDAFQSVCASLQAAGLAPPSSLGAASGGSPKTSVYILPDCDKTGMLESLCWTALHNDSAHEHHVRCVINYLNCLTERINVRNEAKARVWAFLSGFGEYDPLVGRAAQAKLWKWNCGTLSHLGAFLNSL